MCSSDLVTEAPSPSWERDGASPRHHPGVTNRDLLAVGAGAIRLASGVSFLVDPERANVLWANEETTDPTASLLLRSMGYRDALVGGMLLRAGLQGSDTVPGWFLASAGADLADLLGGLANHDRLSERSRTVGIWSAAAGVGIGALGAWRARLRAG